MAMEVVIVSGQCFCRPIDRAWQFQAASGGWNIGNAVLLGGQSLLQDATLALIVAFIRSVKFS
jgi:hypothetical protein